ncbi:hypothetical protein DL98DRAFT_570097 [Cadophora sp. DSE1049]|nr:hypothetical protein DL98DRAFT_570097 [Cadophora sp. DSE1049]
MDSPPRFPLFPKLALELRLRIPTATSSPRHASLHLPHTNNLHLHTQRTPRITSPTPNLLPDLHSPFPVVQNTTAPRQKIRFNPSKDSIFIDLPSLYALFNITQIPPDPTTLARFVGFGKIVNLSTPLEDPSINGMLFLARWLFTGLPPTAIPSGSSNTSTDLNDTPTSQVNSISINLSFHSTFDMTHAHKRALNVSLPVRSCEIEGAKDLLRTTRVIFVQDPLGDRLDEQLKMMHREWEAKLGRGRLQALREFRVLRWKYFDLMESMDAELWGFFEVRGP